MNNLFNYINIENSIYRLDNSGFSDFCKCPTHGHFKQHLRKAGADENKADLNFGQGIHYGMELRYRDKLPKDKCLLEVNNWFARNPQPQHKSKTVNNALKVMEEYYDKYEGVDYDVLDVEKPIEFELGSIELERDVQGKDRVYKAGEIIRVFWIGKVDLVCKDPSTGEVFIVDHKTSGRESFSSYPMSGQFKGYLAALNVLKPEYGPMERFEINLIVVTYAGAVKLVRGRFKHDLDALKEWQQKTLEEIGRFFGMAQTGSWGSANWGCCQFWYAGACVYVPVCETTNLGVKKFLLESSAYVRYDWSPLEN